MLTALKRKKKKKTFSIAAEHEFDVILGRKITHLIRNT